MPEIKPYEDMVVELIRAPDYAAEDVGLALSITMSEDGNKPINKLSDSLAMFLIDAEHTSPLEQVSFTFLVSNVSRSFLAQITRQRTFKPISGSQHYQNYSDYPCSVHADLVNHTGVRDCLSQCYKTYDALINVGVPPEEARQVLPNAANVNYMFTCDARNLWFFLRQRLCNRNVTEMRIFASRVLSLVQPIFPELFTYAGPQCHNDTCKQGKMRCQEKTFIQL